MITGIKRILGYHFPNNNDRDNWLFKWKCRDTIKTQNGKEEILEQNEKAVIECNIDEFIKTCKIIGMQMDLDAWKYYYSKCRK